MTPQDRRATVVASSLCSSLLLLLLLLVPAGVRAQPAPAQPPAPPPAAPPAASPPPAAAAPSSAPPSGALRGALRQATRRGPLAQRIQLDRPSPQRVFIFLAPIAVRGGGPAASGDLGTVLTRLARSRLNSLEEVQLKTAHDMPDVPQVMTRFGDFEKLDRVSLIAVKNTTGFDGYISLSYGPATPDPDGEPLPPDAVDVHLTYVDFRSGNIFKKRHYKQPINAALFASIEEDLVEFATTLRRSYRVTLQLTSSPNGAAVHVNGRKIGVTPLVHELKAGNHRIQVSAEGYRPFDRTYFLKDGDRLVLDAVLYNPLASRFLNARPGLRIDSRQLHIGYRYVYLGLDRPNVREVHFADLSFLLRIGRLDYGLRFSTTAEQTAINTIDTFVGTGQGMQRYDLRLLQVMGVAKLILWEKYSFAQLQVTATAGATRARTTLDSGDDTTRWSFATDGFVELVSRLGRGKNFSLELQASFGVSYLGQLAYEARSFSLFGQGNQQVLNRHMVGPALGLTARFVFWNDIF
jgi:hypothetical protein